jgi:hypothetical protein
LKENDHPARLVPDMNLYSMKIAKKKNGKPNSDYPSTNIFYLTFFTYFTI